MTDIIISFVQNGIVIEEPVEYRNEEEDTTEETVEQVVFEFPTDSPFQKWASFLRYLTDRYGPTGDNYADERVYVVVRPGEKNAKFSKADVEVIWG